MLASTPSSRELQVLSKSSSPSWTRPAAAYRALRTCFRHDASLASRPTLGAKGKSLGIETMPYQTVLCFVADPVHSSSHRHG
mmetsp:Transcript_3483/g.10701  ORF Transcript_3483/g.10701 Transcript_3483/m.10701 type:complete len:82 (-) Transcript_3483:200-445(-)